MKKISSITAHGSDAMRELIDVYERLELEVEVFWDSSHLCGFIQLLRVPAISLEVENELLLEECDLCAREYAESALVDAA